MDESSQRPGSSAHLPRLIALAVVIASSAWIVWAINAPITWPARALHILGAGIVAFMVGGLVGVEAINVFSTLALLSLATEGAILGGRHFGWPGAVLGIVAGFLLAPFAAIAATVLVVALASLGSSTGTTGDQAPVEPTIETPGPEPEGTEPGTPD